MLRFIYQYLIGNPNRERESTVRHYSNGNQRIRKTRILY